MISMAKLSNDTNSKLWQKLFKKSWLALGNPKNDALKGVDKDAYLSGKTSFANLAHYFSYLEQLIKIDPAYLMLPIDETPLSIDANSRIINVPPAFTECSGVQSDNYAEIVTFTIDRYFDYKDLDLAEIVVQWKNGNTEGVSKIVLKDLETYADQNKMRFGWPLTSEMTAAAGKLYFAVRFFTVDAQTQEIDYLLSTAPASITIKSTLELKGDLRSVPDKDTDYFTKAIKNSSNPSYKEPTPVIFKDSLPEAIIKADNSLDLTARATTKDGNALTYIWEYKKYEYTPYTVDPESKEYPKDVILYTKDHADSDYHYTEVARTVNWSDYKGKPLYTRSFTKTTINDATSAYNKPEFIYVPYDLSKGIPGDTLWYKDEGVPVPFEGDFKDAPTEVFLRFAKLSFNPEYETPVLGTYYLTAYNEVYIPETSIVINETHETSISQMNPPKLVKGTKSPSAAQFYDSNTSKIKITLNNDPGADRTYTLINKKNSGGTNTSIPLNKGENDIEVTVPAAGEYEVQVSSSMNRVTNPIHTFGPFTFHSEATAPGLKVLCNGSENNVQLIEGNSYVVKGSESDTMGTTYALTVKGTDLTGTMSAQWQYQKDENGKWIDITDKNGNWTAITTPSSPVADTNLIQNLALDTSANTTTLTIRIPSGGYAYAFKCKVTNTLSDLSPELQSNSKASASSECTIALYGNHPTSSQDGEDE